MTSTLKTTSLFRLHEKAGAKMVPFAGWEMPLQYFGILAEHKNVRTDKGLFDLSHMGEIEIRGSDRNEYLQNLITGDLSGVKENQALYTLMCNPDGGVLDDLVVYRLRDYFLLVVNAANTEKIWNWMLEHRAGYRIDLQNRTEEIALLSIQGPHAEEFLKPFASCELSKICYYHFDEGNVDSIHAIIARTGYTGEDGFELFVDWEEAAKLWERFCTAVILPIGLGARDTLRLEAGYPLYGNDLDEKTTPLEAGLSWAVKLDGNEFIGKRALENQRKNGVVRRQIAFAMDDKNIPRPNHPVVFQETRIGCVTSGTFSPSLHQGIGLALVETLVSPGDSISIMIRGEAHPAKVVKKPFVKGSVKRGS